MAPLDESESAESLAARGRELSAKGELDDAIELFARVLEERCASAAAAAMRAWWYQFLPHVD